MGASRVAPRVLACACVLAFACVPGLAILSCGEDEPVGPPAGPPATVTDLRVAAADTSGLLLRWTAPGAHNTTGVASRYDLRSSSSDTTAWAAMERRGSTSPRASGSPESLWVRPLPAGTHFSFQLAAVNADSAWSSPSNRAAGATLAHPIHGAEGDSAWWDGFAPGGNGVEGTVRSLRIFRNDLMVCGSFVRAGPIETGCVAAWNGSAWQPVGGGVSGGSRIGVSSVTEYQGDFVVAGQFTTAGGVATGCVARWDGTRWSDFGPGIDGEAIGAVEFEGDLLVSGHLTLRPSGLQVDIARWDGSAWSKFGPDLRSFDGVILTVYQDRLYAGVRYLIDLDGDAFCYVYGWQVDHWEPTLIGPRWMGLPYCCPGLVNLGTAGDRMIAVGEPIGVMCQVGVFDGSTWQGLNPPVLGNTDMTVPVAESFGEWHGLLVVGGWFRSSRSPSSCNLTVLDGGTWRLFGSGIGICRDYYDEPEGTVLAIAEYQGDLYVGGSFALAGLKPSQNIARWRGTAGLDRDYR